jgi:hypothetical protein
MSGVLAGVTGSKSNVDDTQVEVFMKQPKLQFMINCLVEDFAKFSAPGGKGVDSGGGTDKKKKTSRRRNTMSGALAQTDSYFLTVEKRRHQNSLRRRDPTPQAS